MTTETNSNFTVGENNIPLPTRGTRKKLVIASLLFCWTTIIYIVLKGDPTNSLHTSALAWAFASWLATFGAYVFGAAWENGIIQGMLKK
jgi:ABC-type antimicrobial peptide transport system permease subunit